jgi:hypothetical protein
MPKPSLFVGSSTEGLDFARAVRTNLVDVAETTLWNEGFFKLGGTFIETLVNSVSRFDFAVLVLTPDDWITSRDERALGPRDNVLFELGLFMGRLGRARTFIIHQAGAQIKMPTDLSGVTTAQYDWPRQDGSHSAAVGPACDAVRDAIADLGLLPERANLRLQEVSREQARQADELNWITRMLVDLAVTEYERMHLQGLSSDGPFWADIHRNSSFESELRRLLSLRLIDRHPGKGLRALFGNEGRRDVKECFFITERGRAYLRAHEAARSEPRE